MRSDDPPDLAAFRAEPATVKGVNPIGLPSGGMSGRGAYRGVLEIGDARALIGASAASQVGDWLYNAALLGYVYSATGTAGWVAAATVVDD